jgi:hypothetical protein
MSPAVALRLFVDPTLALLGEMGLPPSLEARRMLLAIAGQESGYLWRRQQGTGPARGLWQFERGGGVTGVLTHKASRPYALLLCQVLLVPAQPGPAWDALEYNDVLACGFARLLLLTDPHPLPTERDAGWDYYERNWRPGKPRPQMWRENWSAASAAVGVKAGV